MRNFGPMVDILMYLYRFIFKQKKYEGHFWFLV